MFERKVRGQCFKMCVCVCVCARVLGGNDLDGVINSLCARIKHFFGQSTPSFSL